jgi:hypothetical protein
LYSSLAWLRLKLRRHTHNKIENPETMEFLCVLINSSNTTVVDYNDQSTIPPIPQKSTIAATTTTTATNNESESIKGVQEGGFKWLVQSLKLYKLELKRSWNFESLKVY